MKKLVLALSAVTAMTGSASAADLAAKPYLKAPAPVAGPSWTGFYVFGGGGGGLWAADSNEVAVGAGFGGFPAGTRLTRDQRLGGSGWFGTVGAGYDWQSSNWVVGIFGDGQFGDIRGSLSDAYFALEGREKLRTSYAAGARLGYLVAPNVLSYVNGGYSGSDWSGATLTTLYAVPVPSVTTATSSFRRDGWFVGGGVENNLNIFGINAPGWFMRTEYRSAYYNRIALPETRTDNGLLTGTAVTFKPWVQTISTSLVYRFNSGGPIVAATDLAARPYVKAPAAVVEPSWTGFYGFGGAGGGLWNADSNIVATSTGGLGPAGTVLARDQRLGGSGWFGTVGAGYDWQFSSNWVAGIFGDGQFGDIRGSLSETIVFAEGREKLRTSYAAGARLGYLVAPNVLSYVNAGYSGSQWSGTTLSAFDDGTPYHTTPSFHRDGWFVGGGVENSLNLFGIAAPAWFMKTEYRSAFYDRISLPTTDVFGRPGGSALTFKPWVQTISTSLVYRFNSDGAVVAKY
ncbi:outer membrane protein [Bradyrhizobium sp. CCGUVB23]|uniref:outer membrane protein n=1 Tax=Bradyrhizobium sp. CCGUVB23 TaxID=2949630 RepID=UPI0020B2EA34|nr:autotransporter domain-containing protein [Bradyrhizobium sp. CCGUVB23]MCP3466140.1 autotransporter domain-containing protein [Bradyrhizobium sp. CCGUVB23]